MNYPQILAFILKNIFPAFLILIIFIKIIYPILRVVGSLFEFIFLFLKEFVEFFYIKMRNINKNNIEKSDDISPIIKII